MQPAPVVRAALRGLGRKPLVIPGQFNRASNFAAISARPLAAVLAQARPNSLTRKEPHDAEAGSDLESFTPAVVTPCALQARQEH